MIPPMKLVIDALSTILDCDVVSKVPMDRPRLFVRVEQASPAAYGPTYEETLIIVQVYGDDLMEVLDTIGVCREFLRFSIESTTTGVLGFTEIAGPVEFPDPDIPHMNRWQFSGQIYTNLS